MSEINIVLLKEAERELRAIKDGKGNTRLSVRMEAIHALEPLFNFNQAIEKAKIEELAKEVRELDIETIEEMKRDAMDHLDRYMTDKGE